MVSRDTSNPEQVKSDEEMREQKAYAEEDMLKEVLGTFAGRRVLYNILEKTDMQGDVASTDKADMGRFLGRRAVGLEVLYSILTAVPSAYILMQKESMVFEEKFQFREVEEREDDG